LGFCFAADLDDDLLEERQPARVAGWLRRTLT